MNAPDKYDRAIAYLTKHPEHIMEAWRQPDEDTADGIAQAHCLFQYATKTGRPLSTCGCLTQVRRCSWNGDAETPELTAAIRADARIPTRPEDITVESLTVFAEWQRRLDREIRGVQEGAIR